MVPVSSPNKAPPSDIMMDACTYFGGADRNLDTHGEVDGVSNIFFDTGWQYYLLDSIKERERVSLEYKAKLLDLETIKEVQWQTDINGTKRRRNTNVEQWEVKTER